MPRVLTFTTEFFYHGTSLKIIIKDSIMTQTLLTQCPNFKSSFILWYFYNCSVLKISENNTLVFVPMLSTYMSNSNQLLVYQFNTLWEGHILMSSEKHPSNFFYTNLQQISFFLCKNCKDTKHLNHFSRCIKTIENLIESILCKII